MNNRMGRIKDIDKFDGSFFGFLDLTADEIEPEARILLEKTYEAIVDAGIYHLYLNLISFINL